MNWDEVVMADAESSIGPYVYSTSRMFLLFMGMV